jgi:Arc/MetJ-type ribon-helix-helix transcriptional regulator
MTTDTTKQLDITLPIDMADMLQAKVDEGRYASVSLAIEDAVRLMQARHAEHSPWTEDV